MKRILALLLCGVAAYSFTLAPLAHSAPGVSQTDSRVTWFSCNMVSTATTLTAVTGCGAVTGTKYHITSVTMASSIISTAANYFILSSGTGAACVTTNTARWGAMSLAFTTVIAYFPVPIVTSASELLCFIHAAAGTKDFTVTGYLAK